MYSVNYIQIKCSLLFFTFISFDDRQTGRTDERTNNIRRVSTVGPNEISAGGADEFHIMIRYENKIRYGTGNKIRIIVCYVNRFF